MIYRTVTIEAKLEDSLVEVVPVLDGDVSVSAELSSQVRVTQYPDYSGAYEFVPTAETQTIPTDHLVLLDNIVIDPIPSNYGLISWDGVVITVS